MFLFLCASWWRLRCWANNEFLCTFSMSLGRLFTNVAVKKEFWRNHDRFTIKYNSFVSVLRKVMNISYPPIFTLSFSVSPLDPISRQSVSDNFLGVEFFSWSVTIKFCPQPSLVTRDYARWIPSLFPVRPNSSGYYIRFFCPRFCSQDLRLRSDRQWFWKNTCALFPSLIYVIIK